MKAEPIFKKDFAEALCLAKETGAYLIYSIAPGGHFSVASDWGYWIEKDPNMIRTWEKVIYDPTS